MGNYFYDLTIECEIIEYLFSLKEYQEWLGSLPSLLCKPKISGKVVDVLSILSRQNNNVFLDALREQLPKILGKYLTYFTKKLYYFIYR